MERSGPVPVLWIGISTCFNQALNGSRTAPADSALAKFGPPTAARCNGSVPVRFFARTGAPTSMSSPAISGRYEAAAKCKAVSPALMSGRFVQGSWSRDPMIPSGLLRRGVSLSQPLGRRQSFLKTMPFGWRQLRLPASAEPDRSSLQTARLGAWNSGPHR